MKNNLHLKEPEIKAQINMRRLKWKSRKSTRKLKRNRKPGKCPKFKEVRSSSISPEPEQEIQETRTVSLLPLENVKLAWSDLLVAYQVEDEDDEDGRGGG